MVITTIKLVVSVKQYYRTMGIYPKQPNQYYTINARNIFFSLSMALISISTSAFFIFKASSIREYAETLYIASTQMTGLFIFLITFWKMPKILAIIEKSEELIEKSKFQLKIHPLVKLDWPFFSITFFYVELGSSAALFKYTKLSVDVEKITKLFYFVLTKLTWAGMMAPSICVTFTNYFVYHLGNESFFLSCPVM